MSDDLLRFITPLRKAGQVQLICRAALPGVLAAIRSLERTIQAGETEGRQTEGLQKDLRTRSPDRSKGCETTLRPIQ